MSKQPGKWFYPIQAKAKEALKNEYPDGRQLQWQEVTENRVFEMYWVYDKTGAMHVRLVLYSKANNGFVTFHGEN